MLVTNQATHEILIEKALTPNYHIIFREEETFHLEELSSIELSFLIIDEFTLHLKLLDLLSTLRRDPKHAFLPILVISKRLKIAHVKKLIDAGASDILIEPLDEGEILMRLAILTQQKGTQKKMIELNVQKHLHSIEDSPSLQHRFLLNHSTLKQIEKLLGPTKTLHLIYIEFPEYPDIHARWKQRGTQALDKAIINLLSTLVPKSTIQNIGLGRFILATTSSKPPSAAEIANAFHTQLIETPQAIYELSPLIATVAHHGKQKLQESIQKLIQSVKK